MGQVDQYGLKRIKMGQMGLEWIKMGQMGLRRIKMGQMGLNGSKSLSAIFKMNLANFLFWFMASINSSKENFSSKSTSLFLFILPSSSLNASKLKWCQNIYINISSKDIRLLKITLFRLIHFPK